MFFGVDNISSVYFDNKKKDILVLGKDPTQGLDDIAITAGAEYYINFSRLLRKLCLSFHYNGRNSFLFLNSTKKYQFKTKIFEIKPNLLYLESSSKDFAANNIKKKQDQMDMFRVWLYDWYVHWL